VALTDPTSVWHLHEGRKEPTKYLAAGVLALCVDGRSNGDGIAPPFNSSSAEIVLPECEVSLNGVPEWHIETLPVKQ